MSKTLKRFTTVEKRFWRTSQHAFIDRRKYMMRWTLLAILSVTFFNKIKCLDNDCIMSGSVKYTRCLSPSPDVIKSGISPSIKAEIVKFHNQKREEAKASNMMKLYWNDTVAAIAQIWANQCTQEHDYLNARAIPGWVVPLGQNLGYGIPKMLVLMKMWYDEKKLWERGERNELIVGHYTQMMSAISTLIGCGYAACKQGYHFVCNYAIGQPLKSINEPFKQGPTCDTCRSNCVGGLCDCRGRMCFHYGTLDANTCTCKCHPNFKGPLCEQKICGEKDDLICTTIPKDGIKFFCNRYANIPVQCPFLCGICP